MRVLSRLHTALLITTTFIVIPNNAGAQNRNMNGTGARLLLGNIDTAYLGVSFPVFSSAMLIIHTFTVFTRVVVVVFFYLTPASALVESLQESLRGMCNYYMPYVWPGEAGEV